MYSVGKKRGVPARSLYSWVCDRKAQVTTFIIIGLILLFIIGVLMWIKYKQAEIDLDYEISSDPVVAYVQQCSKDLLEEALVLAGQQGGYINLDNFDKLSPQLDPFNADMLSIADGALYIPYWFYQKSDNLDHSNMPELHKTHEYDGSVQDQVENYIEENLFECLGNFDVFTEQGMDIQAEQEFYAEVQFNDETTNVDVFLPITVIQGTTLETLDTFRVSSNVAFKTLFTLASEITEHEMNNFFLEYSLRNFITSYSGVDDDYLPPIAGGFRFENCANRVFWLANDVEENFRTMLSYNVPYLKVDNSDVERITLTSDDEPDDKNREVMQGIYDNMIQSVSLAYYPTVRADFMYLPDFPLHLDLGSKGIIQPASMELNLLFMHLCMFDYSFFYDAKFPVLVMLTDSGSDVNNQPYVFQFALQGVLRNNFPRVSLNEIMEDALPDLEAEVNYQCDPEQFVSGESIISVNDPSGDGIDDAVVLFQCGPSLVFSYDEEGNINGTQTFGETCFIGTTEEGTLTSEFPPCIGGGHITVQHQDYVEQSFMTGDIVEGEGFEQEVTLQKVYNKKLNIRKFIVKKPVREGELTDAPGVVVNDNGDVTECNIYLEEKPMQDYENALVTITKLDVENGVLNTAPIVLYIPGQEATIDLAAGEYLVDILLIRYERYPGEMTIKAQSQSFLSVNEFGQEETVYYPDEDILIEQIFTGGSLFEWTISESDLKNTEEITLYVIDEDRPTGVMDIGEPVEHREACLSLNWLKMQPVMSS